jgi:hypothetical protein
MGAMDITTVTIVTGKSRAQFGASPGLRPKRTRSEYETDPAAIELPVFAAAGIGKDEAALCNVDHVVGCPKDRITGHAKDRFARVLGRYANAEVIGGEMAERTFGGVKVAFCS